MLFHISNTLAVIAPGIENFAFQKRIFFINFSEIVLAIYGIQAFWPFLLIIRYRLTIFQNTLYFVKYFDIVYLNHFLIHFTFDFKRSNSSLLIFLNFLLIFKELDFTFSFFNSFNSVVVIL